MVLANKISFFFYLTRLVKLPVPVEPGSNKPIQIDFRGMGRWFWIEAEWSPSFEAQVGLDSGLGLGLGLDLGNQEKTN